MSSVFEAKLSPRIRCHLQNVDLQSLSRIDASRLSTKAIPNVGSIELVTSSDFKDVYDKLYIAMFPKCTERERSDLIIDRLAAQDANKRPNLAPYRIIGIRDDSGAAIGAAHISVLPLRGGSFSVPYLQYIYVRAENRGQDMSEVLHTIVLGVAAADAAVLGRTVPFTMFETDPPGHGDDSVSRAYSLARVKIHEKTGGVALVVVRDADGKTLSAHVQPGLEPEHPPLTLLWVVRPSPGPIQAYDIQEVGPQMVAAFYQSLRDEGFPEKNIRLAEQMVKRRFSGASFKMVPLSSIPSLGPLCEDSCSM